MDKRGHLEFFKSEKASVGIFDNFWAGNLF